VVWRAPRRKGRYDVRVTAVDLAGNVGSAAGTIDVVAPRRAKRRP
jgi:hypothetical protein